jgi:ribulose-5-phosphate 4-epimerase/fuculose-1-phosphate aldolase
VPDQKKKENAMKDESKELRGQVAQCCRMLEACGLIDFSGHVSSRSGDNRFLINSRDQSRFTAGPEDLVEADLDGRPLGKGDVPSEVFIYSSIYRVKPEVNAIAHLHSPAVITLSIARREIFPATLNGALFADGIPMYEDSRLINSPARGDLLARTLGHARAIVIRGHGSVVVAENIKTLFLSCVYFERNAQRLVEAYPIGSPKPLPADQMAELKEWLIHGRVNVKVWEYYASKLEKPSR